MVTAKDLLYIVECIYIWTQQYGMVAIFTERAISHEALNHNHFTQIEYPLFVSFSSFCFSLAQPPSSSSSSISSALGRSVRPLLEKPVGLYDIR